MLGYSTIRRWVREFNNGRSDGSKKHLCGRPVSATDGENVEKVGKLLNDDRRYMCTEIAHELDISRGSAHSILTERLKMRKVAARWVPHMLSDSEKHHRVKIARSLLHRYGEEGDEMLQRIVAIDETWIGSFEPELKRQNSEWHTKDSPRPLKFCRSQNWLKLLMIFAYDFHGVLTAHQVPTGRTVNKEYYEKYLRTVLCPALRRKRSELINCTPLILHDNALPHKSNVVKELLEGYGWEVLEHPPYSPDLSPPDFDLFPKLKQPLRGVRYNSLDKLECAMNAEVRRINFSCLATGIEALPSRWNSIIRSRADYFEGLWTSKLYLKPILIVIRHWSVIFGWPSYFYVSKKIRLDVSCEFSA